MALIDEKTPLLPIAEKVPASVIMEAASPTEDNFPYPERLSIAELVLIIGIFILVTLITSILNLHVQNPWLLCKLDPSLIHLADALPQSLYLGIPTSIVFFVVSPILVRPDKVAFSRCLVVFCYLLGAVWGAGIFGLGASGQERFSCPITQGR
ncbi:hypothetical protein K432DRAFT_401542 [Lepidopterella palustris CBS 459.81]|uniref:Uncharacterized protein n=1 Tax=Lepidopterella palustris CBS 459.81 TaxID=1314670 RepID=A0A8E2JJ58_9PEZI|nr:hypothetical protein K432DRAFT_401542 [Lepidopterella palustris CBS 459.81]